MDSSAIPISFGLVEFLLLLISVGVLIIPFWRIFTKAGYAGALSLLMLIPLVNIVMLYFLAFADWPIFRGRRDNAVR